MHAFSNFELLATWEKGTGLHPLDRGLLLLTAAYPEAGLDSIADWPLGRRNRELFLLHKRWFGAGLLAQAACPSCNEQMEFELDCHQLLPPDIPLDLKPTTEFRGTKYRVPTSRDLAVGLANESDRTSAEVLLIESCQLTPSDSFTWSEEDIAALGELMAQADPGAETRISYSCQTCGHEQEDALDIAVFVWAELVADAKRLLHEVHTLASAYGWSEAQVLSLSAPRRKFYLEMVET